MDTSPITISIYSQMQKQAMIDPRQIERARTEMSENKEKKKKLETLKKFDTITSKIQEDQLKQLKQISFLKDIDINHLNKIFEEINGQQIEITIKIKETSKLKALDSNSLKKMEAEFQAVKDATQQTSFLVEDLKKENQDLKKLIDKIKTNFNSMKFQYAKKIKETENAYIISYDDYTSFIEKQKKLSDNIEYLAEKEIKLNTDTKNLEITNNELTDINNSKKKQKQEIILSTIDKTNFNLNFENLVKQSHMIDDIKMDIIEEENASKKNLKILESVRSDHENLSDELSSQKVADNFTANIDLDSAKKKKIRPNQIEDLKNNIQRLQNQQEIENIRKEQLLYEIEHIKMVISNRDVQKSFIFKTLKESGDNEKENQKRFVKHIQNQIVFLQKYKNKIKDIIYQHYL